MPTTEYTHALVWALSAEGVGDLGEGFRETFRQETISDERTNPDKKDLTFEECISWLISGKKVQIVGFRRSGPVRVTISFCDYCNTFIDSLFNLPHVVHCPYLGQIIQLQSHSHLLIKR